MRCNRGALVLAAAVGAVGAAGASSAGCTDDDDDATGAPADLVVTLVGPPSATPGEALAYTVTVTNAGRGDALSVVTTFDAPAGARELTAAGATVDALELTWQTDRIVAGASTTLSVTAIAPSVGPLAASVVAATASAETSATNNAATTRALLGFTALATLTGEAANDYYGFVGDSLGDLDGDGRPDFVIGAPGNRGGGNGAGRAYVYSGATATLLYTFTGAPGRGLGYAVASAGDVDADGTPDVAVGGIGGVGVVRVYSGATGALVLDATGPASGSGFGAGVAGIGDIDADGHADLLVGADLAGAAGQAFVLSGATGAVMRSHDGTAGTHFGYGVGALGDVDGDDVPDYAVGGGQGLGGRVYVYSGATGAALYTVAPAATGGLLGQYWIDRVGDIDGDQRPDFYVADIGDGTLGNSTGRGYVISGATGATLHTFAGEVAGDVFGISRNGGFDVDDDGVPDVYVAGYHNPEAGTNAGKAYVYSGATGEVLRTMTGVAAGQTLGYDAIQLGDVDGDGLIDYLLTGDQENGQAGTAYVVRGTPLP